MTLTYVVEWQMATGGTSDYFNECDAGPNPTVGVPNNYFGSQAAADGVAYGGFYNYGAGSYREYIQGNMDAMVPGQTYTINIWVSRAENFPNATDGFGIYFYVNNIAANVATYNVLNVTPQIDFGPTYGIINDATNWVQLSATYTADSAYKHLVLGNFRDDGHTAHTGADYAYYYVDIIQVIPSGLNAVPSHTNVKCHGGNDGTASVAPSMGTPPYSYLWSPGNQTTQSVSGLTAGSYTVRVTDATQDTVRDTIVITEPPALTATTSQTNVTCNGNNNGSATVNVSGGVTPYTYSWAPTGGNNATATGLAPGAYTCTITDSNNCTLQETFTITQPGGLTATTSQTNILCHGASTGSAGVSVSGGTLPYSYAWTPTGGNNATANNLAAGNYTCTVTDGNSCTMQKTFTLTEPTAITATTTQTNISCNGAGNGSASVSASGGVGPYTYSWSPSGGTAASATGLTPGTYTCTITDANNCTLQKTFTITQPAVLSATISHTDVTCYGAGDGTATVVVSGGTLPYTYSWSPSGGTTANATGLTGGTYTCNITDANGCTTSQSATVIQPAQQLSAIPSQTNVLCYGANTGIASVIVSGGTSPYSYVWSPTGGNNPNAYNLVAGAYTCTIKDAHNCTITPTFNITEGAAILAATSHADILCHGNSNGIATVLVNGGTPPYSYVWAPSGGNGPNATGLGAGVYTCTISDFNNCTHTEEVTIAEPAALSFTDSVADVKCYGDSNGYAQVNVTGGTAPYTFTWSPSGGNGFSASNMTAGTYTCEVKDYNACIAYDTLNISQPEQLTVHATKVNLVCQGQVNTGSATAVGTGGVGPYSYLWTPGNTTDTMINNLGLGQDTCIVTDANGCTYRAIFNIVDTSLPFHYSILDSATDCRSSWLNAVADSGSSEAVAYTWLIDTSVATTNPLVHTFAQDGPHSMSLVVVDAVGCHDTLSHNVNINKPMVADFSYEPDPPMPNAPLQFHNLSSPYASLFRWDFGDGTESIQENPDKLYSDSGTFHVCLVASNEHNCTDTACKDIKVDIDKVAGVPSAFSPNGDGENDVLYVRGFRIKTLHLRVYNRWGNVIFETDTKDKGWDGTYKGQPQPAEVYAYTLDVTYLDGSTKQVNGSITLLR